MKGIHLRLTVHHTYAYTTGLQVHLFQEYTDNC